MLDYIIVGTGFAGSVCARQLAEKNKKILILDKRNHIGGNAYDEYDNHGVLVHKYGPHIFHTNYERVYEYLKRFGEMFFYEHKVVAKVKDKELIIPFNINTLYQLYEKSRAEFLENKLLAKYSVGEKVSVMTLLDSDDKDIVEIGKFVYENIFLYYTMKQWGKKPEEIDKSILLRVPVLISRDDRYFTDKYQYMPLNGFTKLFDNILNHKNIEIRLNTDIKSLDELLSLKKETGAKHIIFTGEVDRLCGYQFGYLPYRSLEFKFEYYDIDSYQSHAVVNYTVSEDYTRITEFKKLTNQEISGTTIIKEYSSSYEDRENQTPYYSINNDESNKIYEKYAKYLNENGIILLGRLAEFKYYNMDIIINRALELSDNL